MADHTAVVEESWSSLPGMTTTICALLWAAEGQEDALAEYEDTVLALIPRHGGEVVSRVQRVGDGTGPTEVHVIRMPDGTALQSFIDDPDRLALADVFREVVDRAEIMDVRSIP